MITQGMNNGAFILFKIVTPPKGSAGKNFKSLHPFERADSNSDGVANAWSEWQLKAHCPHRLLMD
jgi:hypothetical protein